ncbi:MAG TPA: V-type ATP synthase subunit A, partial [Kiritimatiellia bacterium]|nr:V-type ATP synthase subunit A [Kiritimatiellia bacterium]
VYLQQNAFSDIDAATPADRQREMFDVVEKALLAAYPFKQKDEARKFFQGLTQTCIDWNNTPQNQPDFATRRNEIVTRIEETSRHV